MILQLPLTSLSETFGLTAQPLPCTRNVYNFMRVRASSSVLHLPGCMRQIAGEPYSLAEGNALDHYYSI